MHVINLAAEAGTKLDLERNRARAHDWGRHALFGLFAAICSAIFCWRSSFDIHNVGWVVLLMSLIYFGLAGVLTVNFIINCLIYSYGLKRSQKPYEHAIFIPSDVAETKAHGKCSCEIEAWEKHVLHWANDNVGKSAMRKSGRGYRFYFEKFEDYALFKLWV